MDYDDERAAPSSIDLSLVRRLVTSQFPQWAGQSLRPVEHDGWGNRSFSTWLWQAGLHAQWQGPAVWIHGDVSAANLLVREGRLSAVIDFGNMGVGDRTCDLTIAWTLWKALITLVASFEEDTATAERARHVIDELVAEVKG